MLTGGPTIALSFLRCRFVYSLEGDLKPAQRLANLPVAAAAIEENASVENRWCQLRDTVQSTVLAVLGRARHQHQDQFGDNDAVISGREESPAQSQRELPHRRQKPAFYRSRRLV
nr:unnamed protein product [Spirometra erinaceieuropaei]